GILRRDARHDLAPEHHAREHVGLVDRRNDTPPRARRLEGLVRDALDLRPRVLLDVPRALIGAAALAPLVGRLPREVRAAGQLANDEDVEAVAGDIRPQRA